MNKVTPAKQAAILRCLVDGNSIRATCRITGTAKATALKLLVEVGEFCSLYQDHVLRHLPSNRIEADEIWAFCRAKARNATQPRQGDIWTFTAIDADSKIMVSWLVGDRTPESALAFMEDVQGRLTNRVQLTTDGHHMYLTAVGKAFGYNKVDYAMLVKTYDQPVEKDQSRRYSPPICTGVGKERIMVEPVKELVSTSYVERANLTLRMQQRRFTRLTNGFSRNAENHAHAVGLYFMYYNFCRPHTTLTTAKRGVHTTLAMAAGVTERVWKLEDVLALMEPTVKIG